MPGRSSNSSAQHKGEVRDLFPSEPFNKVGAGWFVARNDIEFLTFLNTAVDWLVSSGEVAQIAKKYELGSASRSIGKSVDGAGNTGHGI